MNQKYPVDASCDNGRTELWLAVLIPVYFHLFLGGNSKRWTKRWLHYCHGTLVPGNQQARASECSHDW